MGEGGGEGDGGELGRCLSGFEGRFVAAGSSSLPFFLLSACTDRPFPCTAASARLVVSLKSISQYSSSSFPPPFLLLCSTPPTCCCHTTFLRPVIPPVSRRVAREGEREASSREGRERARRKEEKTEGRRGTGRGSSRPELRRTAGLSLYLFASISRTLLLTEPSPPPLRFLPLTPVSSPP